MKKEPGVQRSNYQEVKNYLHNELGVTKEYVHELVKELVQDEVGKVLNSGYIHDSIDKSVGYRVGNVYGRGFGNSFENNVRGIIAKEVGRRVVENLNIEVKQSEAPQQVNFIYHIDNK
jgi:uncharacterized protein (DUF2164 family)